MFRGFPTLVLPEYEVLTPQTKETFCIHSLIVAQEERLKNSSIASQVKIAELLYEIVYNCITKKPEKIQNFTTFLQNVSVKDVHALIYGLHHISYGEVKNYSVSCSKCEKTFEVTTKISNCFGINMYPGEDNILQKEWPVKLEIAKDVTVFVYQPTLFDELNLLKEIGSRLGTKDVATSTIIIKKIVYEPPEEKGIKVDPIIFTDRADIAEAYLTLASKDRKMISEAYKEQFGKYEITLKMLATCTHCGMESEIDIDLVDAFFRALYGL